MDRLIRFGKDVVNGWLDAGAFTLAASLAYYAIFSIAPLVLISIHLASLFLDRSAAVEGLTKELGGLIGPTGSDAIKQMLDAAGTAQPQGWAGLVGIAVLLFAAAGFVGSLQDAQYGRRRRVLMACGRSLGISYSPLALFSRPLSCCWSRWFYRPP